MTRRLVRNRSGKPATITLTNNNLLRSLKLMKKFYSTILSALLACISMPANAIDITVNVDDPARVGISVNYSPVDVVAGDNHYSVEEYQSVSIKAKEGAFITKVVKSMDGAEDSEEYVSNLTECSIYVSSYNAGATWTVTSVNADEARDGSCQVYVDDPTNVTVQRNGTYSTVQLAEGWNEVKYMTDKELPLSIGPTNYGTALYQVKMNGEPVAPEGTTWRISPANGDKVEVLANFPDIDIPVRFSYASEEAKGFVTSVTVNGETVTDYNGEGFTVKAGSKMTVAGNINDYKLNSFTVNGLSTYFYNEYSFIVTEETAIAIDAKKYGTVKATLNVDNADNIIVYKGYSYNNDIIPLVSGENEIELSETNPQIQIKAVSGCNITSVTANGQRYSTDYSGAYTITVTDGMNIEVESYTIERNSKAMVYIDDRSAAAQYFNFMRGDRSEIGIVTGYNEVMFYEGDNPFGLSWYGASYANVYKNNEAVNPMYEGSTTYELNLADGDVVKIFLASNPSTYDVEFTAESDVETDKVAVTMDRIRTLDDWTGKQSVLQGTEFSIRPDEGYGLSVSVNGKKIAAGADGTFVFAADENTAVSVALAPGTAIGDVQAQDGRNDIYNMQGMRVMRNAADLQTSGLPAGMYIINGKKVIKK